jgi:hypothetical protein
MVRWLHSRVVPPTINLDNLDPECDGLDLVPHEARERRKAPGPYGSLRLNPLRQFHELSPLMQGYFQRSDDFLSPSNLFG